MDSTSRGPTLASDIIGDRDRFWRTAALLMIALAGGIGALAVVSNSPAGWLSLLAFGPRATAKHRK